MTFLVFNHLFGFHYFFWHLYFILSSNLLCITCILCFYVKNPVFSLIFLIMSYLNAAILMLFFGMQFLVFIFLLVYAGAISILLLFTLMLLNLKIIFYKNVSFKYFILFFIIIIFFEIILFFYKDYFLLFYYAEITAPDWFSIVFFKNEIESFGVELFLNNKDLVFLSAIFLFLILISSINVVLTVKYSKKQKLELQLKNINKIMKR